MDMEESESVVAANSDRSESGLKEVQHHQRLRLCENRPAYRQGRKLKAIKVYTISDESRHLFVYGIPKINLRNELKSLCSKYGKILKIGLVLDHKTEIFTECYHVTYEKIQSARNAKRLLDDRSFYGGILHVCYAPEFESAEETLNKLVQRKHDVLRRLQPQYVNKEVDNQIFAETQVREPPANTESVPIGPQIPSQLPDPPGCLQLQQNFENPEPPMKKIKVSEENKRIVFHKKS